MTDENIHLIKDIPNKNITDEEKTKLKNQINESLIGGVKIVIRDRVYDSSIKYKLEQLKSSLIKKGA